MNAPRFRSGRKAKMLSALLMLNLVVLPRVPPGSPPWTVSSVGAWNCPVLASPGVFAAPVDSRFTASEVVALRLSSANFTRSRICFSGPGGTTRRLLTTALPNGAAKAAARSEAA
jgi:hypothetical protein